MTAPPTSMTIVSGSSTFMSRERVTGAPANCGRRCSSHTPSASSAWKAPEWVPMGAAGNKFLAVARGEVDAALVGRGFGALETEPTNFSVRLTD